MLKKFLLRGEHGLKSLETALLEEYIASRTSFAVPASYSTKESLYTGETRLEDVYLNFKKSHS